MNVKWWAWGVLISNIGIIVTGAAVRLTGSGLGCATWPRCTEESFVPHAALGWHGAIEFGNRLLTFVLAFFALGAFIAIWRWNKTSAFSRRLSFLIGVGIPFQGVIGGITVLTDLNPWVVALHLLLSMALVAAATVLLTHVQDLENSTVARYETDARSRQLIWAAYGVLLVAIYVGTIVTGSGPHAGDANAPRNGLDPAEWSRFHALTVWLFVALLVVILIRTRLLVAVGLMAVTLAQGLIGYIQYFTGLPIVLVGAHLLGSAVLLAVATRLVLVTRSPTSGTEAFSGQVESHHLA